MPKAEERKPGADKGEGARTREGEGPAGPWKDREPLTERRSSFRLGAIAAAIVAANACGSVVSDDQEDGQAEIPHDVSAEDADLPDIVADEADAEDGVTPDIVPDGEEDAAEVAETDVEPEDVADLTEESDEAGVLCEGVFLQPMRTYTLRLDEDTSIGGYNVRYTGANPEGTGVLMDIACASDGNGIATGLNVRFGDELRVERTEEGMRLRVAPVSETSGNLTAMGGTEPL